MRLRCALFECCFPGTSGIHSKLPNLGYTKLVNATRHFHPSKDLGWRTYGNVYYGILGDLREIAIERCSRHEFCIIQEHLQDSSFLSLLPHKNLVSVYGYGSSGEEFLLAHEYIPNGTLDHHLHGKGSRRIILPWHTRLDIAIDTANALAYLHSNGIIHSEVTAGSILLDENLCAKVQGFLISRQLPRSPSGFVAHIQLDGIRRRRGYLDPEYLTWGILSLKSDVYSFGVVLCEILSSKPAMAWDRKTEMETSLIDFAVSKIQNHAVGELLDPNIGFESNVGVKQMLTSVALLAYQCLNDEPSLRPSMEQMLERLKGIREGRQDSNLTADLKHQTPKEEFFQDHIKPKLQIFSHAVLAKATNHYENWLGQGGFGVVYYGNLPDGREVAIKCFHKKKGKAIQQFMKEIEILCHMCHPNLVSLYGCSSSQDYRLHLVYEYVSNGSLKSHLHPNSGSQLPWFTRLNIAIETACALSYLHHFGIIHRDVKPSNILLDKNLGVKVADFGLARFLPLVANASQGDSDFASHVSTAPVGTPAYIDPEYYEFSKVSDKSDVYSYGVLLFQLISSKPSLVRQWPEDITLVDFAMGKMLDNALEELVDLSLGFDSDNRIMETITAVAELAFQCVQLPKEIRPSMKQVFETLEGIKQGNWGFHQIT